MRASSAWDRVGASSAQYYLIVAFGLGDERGYEPGILLRQLATRGPHLGVTPRLADLLCQPTHLLTGSGSLGQDPHGVMRKHCAQLLELAPQGDARRRGFAGKGIHEQYPDLTYVTHRRCLLGAIGPKVERATMHNAM
jgi:hypothetical protein